MNRGLKTVLNELAQIILRRGKDHASNNPSGQRILIVGGGLKTVDLSSLTS